MQKLQPKLETWSDSENFTQYRTDTLEFSVKNSGKNSKICSHEKWLKQNMLESN